MHTSDCEHTFNFILYFLILYFFYLCGELVRVLGRILLGKNNSIYICIFCDVYLFLL
jgi:hypothetical protein